jgi:hypothetical protein
VVPVWLSETKTLSKNTSYDVAEVTAGHEKLVVPAQTVPAFAGLVGAVTQSGAGTCEIQMENVPAVTTLFAQTTM